MTTRNNEPPRSGEPPPEQGPFVRLVEDPRLAPTVDPASDAWALDLLRSAEPYRSPVARKQRVQLRLGYVPRRKAPLALRTAVVLVVLFGCGAFARAALGRWPQWMVRAYERLVPSAATRAPSPTEARPRPPRAVPAERPAPPVEPPALEPAPTLPAPAVTSAPAAASHPHRREAAATEDTAPVLEAMRALRREHNPTRARALLARYLDRHPAGALAEEAMALSIEAAVANQDADAAALAARYLRLYPTGLFRPLARQTLSAAAQQP